MKKYVKFLGYLPAAAFTLFYGIFLFSGVSRIVYPLLLCMWGAALFIHKGIGIGSLFGLVPALSFIYMGTRETWQPIDVEIPIGIFLAIFYVVMGLAVHKLRRGGEDFTDNKKFMVTAAKIIMTVLVLIASFYGYVIMLLYMTSNNIAEPVIYAGGIFGVSFLISLIWAKKRKRFRIFWAAVMLAYAASLTVNIGIIKHNEKITVDTSPNINLHEYLPFDENSKIVKIRSDELELTEDLPVIDGAAALFPVYSAFVNAVYPENTALNDGAFCYNNTPEGYRLLAEKKTDVFIGVYPSSEQISYAEENGTAFCYTPIGTEAFVFFVHKDNPIDSLTAEEIKKIYSGEITNWREVGGKDEEITAFQRNEGSGSQSMLERFMGDTPIMQAPTERRNDLMSGIINVVADYKSKSGSIGFSFRYYVEGIIKNPDIKMIAIDSVAPTAENIRNGSYPVTTPIYAVTYEGNTNENVERFVSWMLSDEGQGIINETGYVGIKNID